MPGCRQPLLPVADGPTGANVPGPCMNPGMLAATSQAQGPSDNLAEAALGLRGSVPALHHGPRFSPVSL